MTDVKKKPHLTYVTGVVLQSIDRGHKYGFDIMDISGLPDGTVYPALRRLEAAGYLSADWEDADRARARRRPSRRYYDLTAAGRAELERARARFPAIDAISAAPTTEERRAG